MVTNALTFLCGIVALQFCAELPAAHWYAAAVPLVIAGCVLPAMRLPALLLAGFLWAAFHAQQHLEHVVPPELEGRTLWIEGRVSDLPVNLDGDSWRFLFHTQRIDTGDGWQPFERRLRLSWYRTQTRPRAGERWQLAVRLKRPHGYANPGGFDYERWLFQRRIAATGYIRHDERNQRMPGLVQGFTSRLRSKLADRLQDQGGSPALALVRALTIGDRGYVDPGQWAVLRDTGTSHLMAISGLHISLVAGLVFWLSRRLWSHLGGLAERVPAGRAAALPALLAAWLYAALAGFSLPTQRALIMVAVAMLAMLSGRQTRPLHVLCLALLLVLAVDPLAVLSAGFWLSFWAVAIILYVAGGRTGRQAIWRQWGHVHLVLAVSLLPVLLLAFQQASLIAPLANLFAVPWVGMLVIPVSLLGALLLWLSETAGGWLIGMATRLLDTLWPVLQWLADAELATWQQPQPPLWTVVPALAGILLLFAPRGVPGRWAGLWLLLPMLTVRPAAPAAGEAVVTLLDVGQGLAAVVQTRHHVLVYDTGPRYGPDFDTGSSVLLPWLRNRGIGYADRLLVSHGDNDHIGGLSSLMAGIPVGQLSAGVPSAVTGRVADACRSGEGWEWDGVGFGILHPPVHSGRTGNNASCVLRIESAGGKVLLLSGDIEAVVEQRLVEEAAAELRADVLVVPHHGSLTSSTPGFIEAVGAATVLHPVGYRNRYGFPRPQVVERYRASGAEQYDTARHGAIRVRLPADATDPGVTAWRCVAARYWRHRQCS